MRIKRVVLASLPFVLLACGVTNQQNSKSEETVFSQVSSSFEYVEDSSKSRVPHGTTKSSTSEKGNSNSERSDSQVSNQSLSSVSSSQELPKTINTIAEIKELCKSVKNLNQSGIGIDETRTFTIRGRALSKFSLVKTTSKFGLDMSSPYKILFGDETGCIAVASSFSNDGNTLWGKVAEHAGKETSNYEITGYLSMYLNQPELYISGKTFTWNENMKVDIDVEKYSVSSLDLNGYYDEAVKTNYNCAGHGYGSVVTVNNLYCFDKRDSVFFFTNGESVMKVVKGMGTFSVGSSYDITGYISTNGWVPSLYALKSTQLSNSSVSLNPSKFTETTIDAFKKNKCSKEDTSSRMDNFIRSFKNIYKSNVYFDAYTENGKYYVTMGDTFQTNTTVSSNHLVNHISYNQVAISNDNYWNVSESQLSNYCPHADKVFENETVEVYYYPYIQEWGSYGGKNNQPIWKVMLLGNYA